MALKNVSKAIANAAKKTAMGMRGFPPNVRTRNANGALRRVRGDKLLKTVRDQFSLSPKSLAGHSGNMELGTLRKMRGVDSEKDILRGIKGLLGGRSTNANGQIRGKRADTKLKNFLAQHGRGKATVAGHSGEMHLGTLQNKRGVGSVKEILGGKVGFVGGRERTASGAVRAKRGDTHVGTIEKQYNVDFGGRSDKHLSTLRKEEGVNGIKALLKKIRG
jgi:hypothetical protein